MRIILAVAVVCLSTPAIADGVVAENCELSQPSGMFASCDVRNETKSAVAKIFYVAEIKEDGRKVPWQVANFEKPEPYPIAGGIESGETVRLFFVTARVGYNADFAKIKPNIFITGSIDADGNEFTYPTP